MRWPVYVFALAFLVAALIWASSTSPQAPTLPEIGPGAQVVKDGHL